VSLSVSDKYLDSIDDFRFLDYLSHYGFSRWPILYKTNYDMFTKLRIRNLICTLHKAPNMSLKLSEYCKVYRAVLLDQNFDTAMTEFHNI